MRFMLIIKADTNTEAGVLPSKELVAAMDEFNEKMVKAGVLLAAEGLHPSSKGARITFHGGGKRTVTDGPFTEAKELIAGFWLIQVKSKEEAIEWASRCPDVLGPGETAQIEIRQVFEMSDFPAELQEAAGNEPAMRAQLEQGWPKAPRAQLARLRSEGDATMRFMMLMIPKGYEKAEAGAMPSAEMVAKMTKYNQALTKAGVLIALDGLHPASNGVRVSFSGGKPRVTDGPFTEAKELLGGYWMIQVKSKQEAVEWASRCPAQDGDVIEVRQVQEMSDFPPEVQKAAGATRLGGEIP